MTMMRDIDTLAAIARERQAEMLRSASSARFERDGREHILRRVVVIVFLLAPAAIVALWAR